MKRALIASIASIAMVIPATFSLGTLPAGASFPGSNGKIVFTSFPQDSDGFDSTIRIIDRAGSVRPLKCAATGGIMKGVEALAWFADGKRLLISANTRTCSGGITIGTWVIDVTTGSATRITPQASSVPEGFSVDDLAGQDRSPAGSPSPDGSRLATICSDSCFWRIQDNSDGFGDYGIWIVETDGSSEREVRVFPSGAGLTEVKWSPDGRRIAFVRFRDGKHYLFTIRPDGSDLKQLTSKGGVYPGQIEWSPNSRRILYTHHTGGSGIEYPDRLPELWTVRADGTGARRILGGKRNGVIVGGADASWSPDGKRIAFVYATDPVLDTERELFAMRADGTRIRPLFGGRRSRDAHPLWQPCPSGCPTIRTMIDPEDVPSASSPPANDDVEDALKINSLPFDHTQASTGSAGRQSGEPSGSCVQLPDGTTWYDYTAAADASVRISVAGSEEIHDVTVFEVSGTSIAEIACYRDTSYAEQRELVTNVAAGVRYLIQVTHPFGGKLELSVEVAGGPVPNNDAYAKARTIMSLPFHDEMDVSNATVESGERTSSCETTPAKTVWYRYVPTSDQSITVSTQGSNYEAVTSIYRYEPPKPPRGGLYEVACGSGSDVTANLSTGWEYYIQVSSATGVGGNLVLDVGATP